MTQIGKERHSDDLIRKSESGNGESGNGESGPSSLGVGRIRDSTGVQWSDTQSTYLIAETKIHKMSKLNAF